MTATETEPQRAATLLNGTYTVESARSGEHRTFSIRTQPDDSKFAPGQRVIALLTGSDNERDYTPFGFVDDHRIAVWSSKRGKQGKRSSYEFFARLIWSLATRGEESKAREAGYTLLVEGRCLICNRRLTDPTSIRTGLGPVCAGRE